MFDFVSHRKKFLSVSGILLLISVLSLIIFGLKPGIDFIGGTMMEIEYEDQALTNAEIKENLNQFNQEIGQVQVKATGDKGFILRFKEINEKTHQEILIALESPLEKKFETIGPVIGQELTRKTKSAIILSLLAIIFYIAWAFRKLSRISGKGESWRYGAGALVALFHDMIILLGLFSLLGRFKGVEIDAAFITAILIVLGYSVNDTIVIYDRVRENLLTYHFKDLEKTINLSVNESLVRSLNTSLTTLLALLAVYLFGGDSIKNFVLAMMVGIGVGTWSSVVVAGSFLLWKRKK
ncbi:MAG: protein translocase subunit SecF [Patescibacteria group bacterium]|jgi:preprotein translocase subunit SecF|nr:protein translocase subunit SecF [Patescibacteria group bacterium]MDD5172987.1 protein translocase subunit SecF [Patescibacteria group bacterium]